jgi:hypothetical protein
MLRLISAIPTVSMSMLSTSMNHKDDNGDYTSIANFNQIPRQNWVLTLPLLDGV